MEARWSLWHRDVLVRLILVLAGAAVGCSILGILLSVLGHSGSGWVALLVCGGCVVLAAALVAIYLGTSRTRSSRPGHAGDRPNISRRLEMLGSSLPDLTMLAETLASPMNRQEPLAQLGDVIRQVFDADGAAIALLGSGEDRMHCYASSQSSERTRTLLRLTAQRAAAERAPVSIAVGDVWQLPQHHPDDPALLVACPLLIADELLGAIVVAFQRTDAFVRQDPLVLSMLAGQLTIALKSGDIVGRLEATNLETVRALATAMEAKDEYTAEHAQSLALTAVAVGKELGLNDADLRELEYAALLHDIGKIGVPGAILNKPEPLTEEEFAEIAKHTILGERISSQVEDLKSVARVIRSAHERWDGSGYPDGLAGEQIPLPSRILLACDAFDAMTSNRPYRSAMPVEIALLELRACAGRQFDPVVVDALLAIWERAAQMRRGGTPDMPIYLWREPGRSADADPGGTAARLGIVRPG